MEAFATTLANSVLTSSFLSRFSTFSQSEFASKKRFVRSKHMLNKENWRDARPYRKKLIAEITCTRAPAIKLIR